MLRNYSFFLEKLFFVALEDKVRIASVRAGNVIGGGDWNTDRLLPDAVRCLSQNEMIPVRNPNSIRPWQHVLDPIHGYLQLAQAIYQSPSGSKDSLQLCTAFNFGPNEESEKTVEQPNFKFCSIWMATGRMFLMNQ